MRPNSIIWFERLYGLAILINASAVTRDFYLYGSLLVEVPYYVLVQIAGLALQIVCFVLAARFRQGFARYVLFVMAALAAVALAPTLGTLIAIDPVAAVLNAGATASKVIAIVFSFTRDARDWFAHYHPTVEALQARDGDAD